MTTTVTFILLSEEAIKNSKLANSLKGMGDKDMNWFRKMTIDDNIKERYELLKRHSSPEWTVRDYLNENKNSICQAISG